ncbi:MAG TPA: NACHT domain-containing protein [Thermomonospora sp.]|nr:NACHT domain-containing protein [Thermomonospora sp.]
MLRWGLRLAAILATAVTVVTTGVAVNQVLNGGEWKLHWAMAAVLFAALAEGLNQWLARREPPQGGTGGGPGRRGVYLRQLRAHVRNMETLGIATQGEYLLRTKHVYVDLSLKQQPPHRAATAAFVGRADASAGERRSLESFLTGRTAPVFAVLGGPGSGKTTLMRATALRYARPWRRRLPVLVYLRDHEAAVLADPAPGLAEVCAAASWVAGRVPPSWLERRLERGRCLVMMDGLDEVADETRRAEVVEWVRRQIDRYPGNVYLLTSRPHGYESNPLPQAEVLQVRRFTGEQIVQFLHGWYYAIGCRATGGKGRRVRQESDAEAAELLAQLPTRPGLYDLAANPLLLTMIANVHKYRGALPHSRAELYEEMCEVLLHRRRRSKRLASRTGLNGHQEEHVMRVLALAMMDARLRDISADHAQVVIAPELAATPATVTPADFLREVSRSGLLVEREQGRYAFAHLTLQEYLAAAHLGPHRPERLTAAVDDPWWRETTLLWSATADATAVINACLAWGTVRALALAFDCAEEARAIDPAVRRDLDGLLRTGEMATRDHRRLAVAVKAARNLREVIWLTETTTICARPVTRDLWAPFAEDERAAGRHAPDPGPGGPEDPAVGMWATAAQRFVAWLNMFTDGTTYRLPTPGELADPAAGMVPALARHTVWTANPGEAPLLYRPPGVPWPYSAPPETLRRYPVADRLATSHYLRLLYARTNVNRILESAAVLALGLTSTSRSSEGEVLLAVALARELAHLRTSQAVPLGHRLHSRAIARASTLSRALGLGPRSPGPLPDLSDALRHALRHTTGHGLASTLQSVAHPYDQGPVALRNTLDTALWLALDLARIQDLARDGAFARALEEALSLAGVREARRQDVAQALDEDRTRSFAALLGISPAPDADLEMILDLGLDLAVDTAENPLVNFARYPMVTAAYAQLVRLWAPRRSAPGADALALLDARLTAVLTERPVPPGTEDVGRLLGEALHALPQSFPAAPWLATYLHRLLHHIHDLVTPILERTAPFDTGVLACARIELLAAIGALRKEGATHVAEPFERILHSLIALQERAEGDLPANEVLLLVRA